MRPNISSKLQNMSSQRQSRHQFLIIINRNKNPIDITNEKVTNYYKDEDGKDKCIKFNLNSNQCFRMIQKCEDDEKIITDENIYDISQNLNEIQIRFKKVSSKMNGALWCIEVFSLLDDSLTNRSAWINVMSKRKIPAKIRTDPKKIKEFKDKKEKSNNDKKKISKKRKLLESNIENLSKKIRLLKEENLRLERENLLITKQIFESNKTILLQNFTISLLKNNIEMNNTTLGLYLEMQMANIPDDPTLNDVNPYEMITSSIPNYSLNDSVNLFNLDYF